MKTRITQSQIKELLALKRAERPPENFFVDFIQEFHRRMRATGLQPGRPATGKGAP
jgi:hypothetical protein